MVLVLECVIICFIRLVPCVVSIANGIEQAVFLFEADVQDRVVEMGRGVFGTLSGRFTQSQWLKVEEAGFTEVKLRQASDKPWIAVLGRKPKKERLV